MSLERTLMSWMRIAVSLIGFGFTIVQFFERFQDMTGVAPAVSPEAPRYFGLALILAGVAALVISIWQYVSMLRYLGSDDFTSIAGIGGEIHRTPTLAIAMLLALIGAFAFIAVVTRYA